MSTTQSPGPVPDAALLAVITNLADEGVPVRAIARSTQVPLGDVLDHLQIALGEGKILQVPKTDWPIGKGQSRENREPQFDPFTGISETALETTLLRLFKVTKLQCSLLMPLLRRKEVTRQAMHETIETRRKLGAPPTEEKLVDVVICNLRKKLKPLGLEIKTIWSQGYYMETEHRRKARDLITEHMQEAALQNPEAVTAAFELDDED
jgi:hypothetical protein